MKRFAVVAVLAFLTALLVHFIRSVPLGRRHAQLQQALVLERAVRAQLALRLAADDVSAAEQRGKLKDNPYAEAVKDLAPGDPVDTKALPLATKARVRGKHIDVAVITLVAEVAGVPIVEVLSEPLPSDHADDWLLESGAVSLRMLERQAIDGVIAATKKPELCPVDIRLADRLDLGKTLDAVLATEGNLPLCRRERQRKLAEEALAHVRQSFPFAPGILLDDVEREALQRLLDTSSVGAKARQLMDAMLDADEDIRRDPPKLDMATLAYDAAVYVRAGADHCALGVAYAHSPNKKQYLARLLNRFLGERWPSAVEANALLGFLYGTAQIEMPKEAAASEPALRALWAKLETLPPAAVCRGIVNVPPFDATSNDTIVRAVLD